MPDNQRLIELALKGLESERARIDDEISQLRNQLRSSGSTGALASTSRRRTMSAEARQKISEAMKRKHAERRGATAVQQPPRGRGLTAAGRKKLSEMMKARWAAKKKSGKKAR